MAEELLGTAPTKPTHAATKGYVDGRSVPIFIQQTKPSYSDGAYVWHQIDAAGALVTSWVEDGLGVKAYDTWTAADGAAWSSQWQSRRGVNTVQSNSGQLLVPSASSFDYARADLTGMTAQGDTNAVVFLTGQVSGVQQYASMAIDGDNTKADWYPNNGYQVELQFSADAPTSGTVSLLRQDNGTQTVIVQATGVTLAGSGTTYGVRLQRTGTTLQTRVWDSSGAEPSTWTLSATLTTALYSGIVGLHCANGGASAARAFRFDNLTVI